VSGDMFKSSTYGEIIKFTVGSSKAQSLTSFMNVFRDGDGVDDTIFCKK
jgi:hypothetical protein